MQKKSINAFTSLSIFEYVPDLQFSLQSSYRLRLKGNLGNKNGLSVTSNDSLLLINGKMLGGPGKERLGLSKVEKGRKLNQNSDLAK